MPLPKHMSRPGKANLPVHMQKYADENVKHTVKESVLEFGSPLFEPPKGILNNMSDGEKLSIQQAKKDYMKAYEDLAFKYNARDTKLPAGKREFVDDPNIRRNMYGTYGHALKELEKVGGDYEKFKSTKLYSENSKYFDSYLVHGKDNVAEDLTYGEHLSDMAKKKLYYNSLVEKYRTLPSHTNEVKEEAKDRADVSNAKLNANVQKKSNTVPAEQILEPSVPHKQFNVESQQLQKNVKRPFDSPLEQVDYLIGKEVEERKEFVTPKSKEQLNLEKIKEDAYKAAKNSHWQKIVDSGAVKYNSEEGTLTVNSDDLVDAVRNLDFKSPVFVSSDLGQGLAKLSLALAFTNPFLSEKRRNAILEINSELNSMQNILRQTRAIQELQKNYGDGNKTSVINLKDITAEPKTILGATTGSMYNNLLFQQVMTGITSTVADLFGYKGLIKSTEESPFTRFDDTGNPVYQSPYEMPTMSARDMLIAAGALSGEGFEDEIKKHGNSNVNLLVQAGLGGLELLTAMAGGVAGGTMKGFKSLSHKISPLATREAVAHSMVSNLSKVKDEVAKTKGFLGFASANHKLNIGAKVLDKSIPLQQYIGRNLDELLSYYVGFASWGISKGMDIGDASKTGLNMAIMGGLARLGGQAMISGAKNFNIISRKAIAAGNRTAASVKADPNLSSTVKDAMATSAMYNEANRVVNWMYALGTTLANPLQSAVAIHMPFLGMSDETIDEYYKKWLVELVEYMPFVVGDYKQIKSSQKKMSPHDYVSSMVEKAYEAQTPSEKTVSEVLKSMQDSPLFVKDESKFYVTPEEAKASGLKEGDVVKVVADEISSTQFMDQTFGTKDGKGTISNPTTLKTIKNVMGSKAFGDWQTAIKRHKIDLSEFTIRESDLVRPDVNDAEFDYSSKTITFPRKQKVDLDDSFYVGRLVRATAHEMNHTVVGNKLIPEVNGEPNKHFNPTLDKLVASAIEAAYSSSKQQGTPLAVSLHRYRNSDGTWTPEGKTEFAVEILEGNTEISLEALTTKEGMALRKALLKNKTSTKTLADLWANTFKKPSKEPQQATQQPELQQELFAEKGPPENLGSKVLSFIEIEKGEEPFGLRKEVATEVPLTPEVQAVLKTEIDNLRKGKIGNLKKKKTDNLKRKFASLSRVDETLLYRHSLDVAKSLGLEGEAGFYEAIRLSANMLRAKMTSPTSFNMDMKVVNEVIDAINKKVVEKVDEFDEDVGEEPGKTENPINRTRNIYKNTLKNLGLDYTDDVSMAESMAALSTKLKGMDSQQKIEYVASSFGLDPETVKAPQSDIDLLNAMKVAKATMAINNYKLVKLYDETGAVKDYVLSGNMPYFAPSLNKVASEIRSVLGGESKMADFLETVAQSEWSFANDPFNKKEEYVTEMLSSGHLFVPKAEGGILLDIYGVDVARTVQDIMRESEIIDAIREGGFTKAEVDAAKDLIDKGQEPDPSDKAMIDLVARYKDFLSKYSKGDTGELIDFRNKLNDWVQLTRVISTPLNGISTPLSKFDASRGIISGEKLNEKYINHLFEHSPYHINSNEEFATYFPYLADIGKDGKLKLKPEAAQKYSIVLDPETGIPSLRGYFVPRSSTEKYRELSNDFLFLDETIGSVRDGGGYAINLSFLGHLSGDLNAGIHKNKTFAPGEILKTAYDDLDYEGNNSRFAQWANMLKGDYAFIENDTSTKGPKRYDQKFVTTSDGNYQIGVNQFNMPDFEKSVLMKDGVVVPDAKDILAKEEEAYMTALMQGVPLGQYSYYKHLAGEKGITFMPSGSFKGKPGNSQFGFIEQPALADGGIMFDPAIKERVVASSDKLINKKYLPKLRQLYSTRAFFGGEKLSHERLKQVQTHLLGIADRVIKAEDEFYEGAITKADAIFFKDAMQLANLSNDHLPLVSLMFGNYISYTGKQDNLTMTGWSRDLKGVLEQIAYPRFANVPAYLTHDVQASQDLKLAVNFFKERAGGNEKARKAIEFAARELAALHIDPETGLYSDKGYGVTISIDELIALEKIAGRRFKLGEPLLLVRVPKDSPESFQPVFLTGLSPKSGIAAMSNRNVQKATGADGDKDLMFIHAADEFLQEESFNMIHKHLQGMRASEAKLKQGIEILKEAAKVKDPVYGTKANKALGIESAPQATNRRDPAIADRLLYGRGLIGQVVSEFNKVVYGRLGDGVRRQTDVMQKFKVQTPSGVKSFVAPRETLAISYIKQMAIDSYDYTPANAMAATKQFVANNKLGKDDSAKSFKKAYSSEPLTEKVYEDGEHVDTIHGREVTYLATEAAKYGEYGPRRAAAYLKEFFKKNLYKFNLDQNIVKREIEEIEFLEKYFTPKLRSLFGEKNANLRLRVTPLRGDAAKGEETDLPSFLKSLNHGALNKKSAGLEEFRFQTILDVFKPTLKVEELQGKVGAMAAFNVALKERLSKVWPTGDFVPTLSNNAGRYIVGRDDDGWYIRRDGDAESKAIYVDSMFDDSGMFTKQGMFLLRDLQNNGVPNSLYATLKMAALAPKMSEFKQTTNTFSIKLATAAADAIARYRAKNDLPEIDKAELALMLGYGRSFNSLYYSGVHTPMETVPVNTTRNAYGSLFYSAWGKGKDTEKSVNHNVKQARNQYGDGVDEAFARVIPKTKPSTVIEAIRKRFKKEGKLVSDIAFDMMLTKLEQNNGLPVEMPSKVEKDGDNPIVFGLGKKTPVDDTANNVRFARNLNEKIREVLQAEGMPFEEGRGALHNMTDEQFKVAIDKVIVPRLNGVTDYYKGIHQSDPEVVKAIDAYYESALKYFTTNNLKSANDILGRRQSADFNKQAMFLYALPRILDGFTKMVVNRSKKDSTLSQYFRTVWQDIFDGKMPTSVINATSSDRAVFNADQPLLNTFNGVNGQERLEGNLAYVFADLINYDTETPMPGMEDSVSNVHYVYPMQQLDREFNAGDRDVSKFLELPAFRNIKHDIAELEGLSSIISHSDVEAAKNAVSVEVALKKGVTTSAFVDIQYGALKDKISLFDKTDWSRIESSIASEWQIANGGEKSQAESFAKFLVSYAKAKAVAAVGVNHLTNVKVMFESIMQNLNESYPDSKAIDPNADRFKVFDEFLEMLDNNINILNNLNVSHFPALFAKIKAGDMADAERTLFSDEASYLVKLSKQDESLQDAAKPILKELYKSMGDARIARQTFDTVMELASQFDAGTITNGDYIAGIMTALGQPALDYAKDNYGYSPSKYVGQLADVALNVYKYTLANNGAYRLLYEMGIKGFTVEPEDLPAEVLGAMNSLANSMVQNAVSRSLESPHLDAKFFYTGTDDVVRDINGFRYEETIDESGSQQRTVVPELVSISSIVGALDADMIYYMMGNGNKMDFKPTHYYDKLKSKSQNLLTQFEKIVHDHYKENSKETNMFAYHATLHELSRYHGNRHLFAEDVPFTPMAEETLRNGMSHNETYVGKKFMVTKMQQGSSQSSIVGTYLGSFAIEKEGVYPKNPDKIYIDKAELMEDTEKRNGVREAIHIFVDDTKFYKGNKDAPANIYFVRADDLVKASIAQSIDYFDGLRDKDIAKYYKGAAREILAKAQQEYKPKTLTGAYRHIEETEAGTAVYYTPRTYLVKRMERGSQTERAIMFHAAHANVGWTASPSRVLSNIANFADLTLFMHSFGKYLGGFPFIKTGLGLAAALTGALGPLAGLGLSAFYAGSHVALKGGGQWLGRVSKWVANNILYSQGQLIRRYEDSFDSKDAVQSELSKWIEGGTSIIKGILAPRGEKTVEAEVVIHALEQSSGHFSQIAQEMRENLLVKDANRSVEASRRSKKILNVYDQTRYLFLDQLARFEEAEEAKKKEKGIEKPKPSTFEESSFFKDFTKKVDELIKEEKIAIESGQQAVRLVTLPNGTKHYVVAGTPRDLARKTVLSATQIMTYYASGWGMAAKQEAKSVEGATTATSTILKTMNDNIAWMYEQFDGGKPVPARQTALHHYELMSLYKAIGNYQRAYYNTRKIPRWMTMFGNFFAEAGREQLYLPLIKEGYLKNRMDFYDAFWEDASKDEVFKALGVHRSNFELGGFLMPNPEKQFKQQVVGGVGTIAFKILLGGISSMIGAMLGDEEEKLAKKALSTSSASRQMTEFFANMLQMANVYAGIASIAIELTELLTEKPKKQTTYERERLAKRQVEAWTVPYKNPAAQTTTALGGGQGASQGVTLISSMIAVQLKLMIDYLTNNPQTSRAFQESLMENGAEPTVGTALDLVLPYSSELFRTKKDIQELFKGKKK